MPWLISQFPELDSLEPQQRTHLLSQLPWWTYPQIAVRAVFIALCIVIIIGGLAVEWIGLKQTLIVCAVLEVVFAAMFYHRQLTTLRSFMRLEIAKAFEGQRPPFCFRCGYDLRGSTQAACPECGKPIEPGPPADAPPVTTE
jgi:hypothetical protein